jgi:hypothetical protein
MVLKALVLKASLDFSQEVSHSLIDELVWHSVTVLSQISEQLSEPSPHPARSRAGSKSNIQAEGMIPSFFAAV